MRILMIGFGVVGRNIAELIAKHFSTLREAYNINLKIVGMSDSSGSIIHEEGIDINRAIREKTLKNHLIGSDIRNQRHIEGGELVDQVNADILIETTPTNIPSGEPGVTHIKKAINKGLDVITTNKGPLATSFFELKKEADKRQIYLKYSGAVGGGTSILDFLDGTLRYEEFTALRGILTGTTNYILWRMEEKGIALNEALKEAKMLGYAEKNPFMDLEGLDTACKLVILANHIGLKAKLSDVEIKGIEKLNVSDVLESKKRGKVIRLIGVLKGNVRVSPEEIPIGDVLHIKRNLNAISVKTNLGTRTLIGAGAGGRHTASSALRDLSFIIQHRSRKKVITTQVAAK